MLLTDHDPVETQEWIDSLRSVVQYQGVARAQFLLAKLRDEARLAGAMPPFPATTPLHEHDPAGHGGKAAVEP